MQMRDLECFLAVAEELHFTRAAQRLHLSQPPLSRHIQDLEAELGVTLFRRTRRSVALTEAGKSYYARVQSVLAQLEQAQEEARHISRGQAGTLTVGFIGALTYEFLPGILRRYRQTVPEVQLVLRDLVPAEQIDGVATGRLDIGFVGILPENCGKEVAHRIVRRDRMLAALPLGHPLCGSKAIPLRGLAEDPWVQIETKMSPAYDRFVRRVCADAGFAPRVEHQAARAQAMLGMVAARLGVTIVPATIARFPWPEVTFVPLKEKCIFEHAVIWRAQEARPVVGAFLASFPGSSSHTLS
jgi:DNA-binding transcriptional LysR family regulator